MSTSQIVQQGVHYNHNNDRKVRSESRLIHGARVARGSVSKDLLVG